jgi:hypothetical protein
MSFTRILHSCRICKVPIELQQDDDCPAFQADVLRKMVVCNRCGDFRKVWWRIEDAIKGVCMQVWTEQSRAKPDSDTLALCRRRLLDLTRKLCARTCDHYRVQFFWQEDFVEQLMEKPEKAGMILGIYEKSTAKQREPLNEQWQDKT